MKVCTRCGSENIVGVEYSHDHPEHYDGVSEWECLACGLRRGRWTGSILATGDADKPEDRAFEPRFGVER